MAQKRKKRRLKRKYRILRNVYIAVVVLAILIIVGYAASKILIKPPELPQETTSSEPSVNVGTQPGAVDSGDHQRRDQTYTFLLACPDQASGNADSIMVVTYDVPNKRIGMLSIPRDTLVNRKNPKINASMHAGMDNLQEVVSDLVGFPLDFTIEIDLKGFEELVDAVGGVDFDVPVYMYYDDPAQDLHIHYEPGVQHLDGQSAMEVCRFRHNADGTGYPMGDVQRAETTQKLMLTVAKKVVSFSNVTRINEFVDILSDNIKTNLSTGNIAWFAAQAIQVDLNNNVNTGSLPGDGSVTYRGTKYCYELFPQESLDLINQLVNPYTTSLTSSDVNIFQAP